MISRSRLRARRRLLPFLAVTGLLVVVVGLAVVRWRSVDTSWSEMRRTTLVSTSSATSRPAAGLETPVAVDGLVLTLLEAPVTFGVQDFVLEVRDDVGAPVDDLTVVFEVDMPDMAMGIQTVVAAHDGSGRYRATVPIGMPGPWQAIAMVERPDGSEVDVAFPFMIQ